MRLSVPCHEGRGASRRTSMAVTCLTRPEPLGSHPHSSIRLLCDDASFIARQMKRFFDDVLAKSTFLDNAADSTNWRSSVAFTATSSAAVAHSESKLDLVLRPSLRPVSHHHRPPVQRSWRNPLFHRFHLSSSLVRTPIVIFCNWFEIDSSEPLDKLVALCSPTPKAPGSIRPPRLDTREISWRVRGVRQASCS